MTNVQRMKLIQLLKRAATYADSVQAVTGNGAEIGSLVGAIVDELDAIGTWHESTRR